MNSFENLTPTEAQIASLIATGRSRPAIAERLSIDVKTVDSHRGHLMRKLGCANAVQLARLAIREGFVSMHEDAL